MQKRKLQIFLSSTYEDLVDHRLAAMEAILAAGHIPAAMEQFAPGDETAWEKIKAWIDESDAFILILGGRYGSIEPTSGKSYVHLEYEYAVEKRKPFFALVVSPEHHKERVKDMGIDVDERDNQQEYKTFKSLVQKRVCGFWNDKKDIKAAVFQKLPEWAQRTDLKGWVRAEETASPEVMNELARLSQENRVLRSADARSQTYDGLTFEELSAFLSEQGLTDKEMAMLAGYFQVSLGAKRVSLLEGFESVFEALFPPREIPPELRKIFSALASFGLIQVGSGHASPTEAGRRFRNRRMMERKASIEAD